MPFISLATGRLYAEGQLPFRPPATQTNERKIRFQIYRWGTSLYPTASKNTRNYSNCRMGSYPLPHRHRPVDDQKTSLYSDRTGVREIVLLPSSFPGLFTTIYEKTNRSEVSNCPSANLLAFCGKDSTLRPSAGIDIDSRITNF